ncbi:MAG: HEAT repeat domain-containing protein [Methanoregula sp.]|uniref:HEAT repeat domain-containing protein n=1 Tax=Methanoregula sp. TaxID=2052170 RepID=UPI003C2823FD
MDKELSKNKNSVPSKSKVCDILKTHHNNLKEDPEHLKSDFLLNLLVEHDNTFKAISDSISGNRIDFLMDQNFIGKFSRMDPIFQIKIIDKCDHIRNLASILLLGKVLVSNSQENKQLALKVLGDIRSKDSFEQLMLGYQDKVIHPSIRYYFQQMGLEGVEHLIKFAQHRNPVIRFNSMIALGEMQGNALGPLLKCLSDENVILRRIAANALGDLGLAQALRSLFIAKTDPDDEVKKRVDESFTILTKNLKYQDFLDLLESN